MNALSTVVAACLVASVAGLHVKFIPCKGDTTEAASVAFIDINPCTADPCNLKRGSTYEISVSIESGPAPASIAAIETHLYGIIAGVKVPFPGFNQTDACHNCGLTCPLAANKPYTYTLPIYIDPKVTIDIECVVELRLVDSATSKDFICDQLQIKVVG